jgi:hypothetical protein
MWGIGDQGFEKICEIIKDGDLRRLVSFRSEPKRIAITEMCDIWAVGHATALALYKEGYTSIEQLRYGNPERKLGEPNLNSCIRVLSLPSCSCECGWVDGPRAEEAGTKRHVGARIL